MSIPVLNPRCHSHQNRAELPLGCPTCHRLSIEANIVTRVVDALLSAGYRLNVHDGDGFDDRPKEPTTDRAAVLAELMQTDDEFLKAEPPVASVGMSRGWVRFVYGNDGPDVVCDYSLSLEEVLSPVNAYADSLM